tara:strand:- start:132 stop:347 length:216 start_codon:yes stop_codon:yes gene_type:complete
MEEKISIYNASEPILSRDSYKNARMKERQKNRINDDDETIDMSGPAMMAIDRAISRSSRRSEGGPRKMRRD